MEKSIENRFNLVRERWIPIAGKGKASLMEVFSDHSMPAFGGNAIEKITLLKLSLAIAQAAYTPADDDGWRSLGPAGLAAKAATYLALHEDDFWLYGDRPFLQMPAIARARKQPAGALLPMIATGNTTRLFRSQIESTYSDGELSLLVVTIMNFALGGGKADNSIVLSPAYQGKNNVNGKPVTAKGGPALGFLGYLHSFILGETIRKTLWYNLLTIQDINNMPYLSGKLGVPPWEMMPSGEDDSIARRSRESYLGRLMPLSRFILLAVDGIHYSEGILLPGHKEGAQDASVAVSTGNDPKALWTNTEQRPWRQLPALLSFFDIGSSDQFDCRLLRAAIPRISSSEQSFIVWSAGLKVSSNAGEQYVSGLDDFVESEVLLTSAWLGQIWFQKLKLEMEALKGLSKSLYGSITSYYKALNADGTGMAASASDSFWKKSEGVFQDLVAACGALEPEVLGILRQRYARFAQDCYDQSCPRTSSRQIDSWAEHRLTTYRYLNPSEDTKASTVAHGKRKVKKQANND